jgi:hypothetical protein
MHHHMGKIPQTLTPTSVRALLAITGCWKHRQALARSFALLAEEGSSFDPPLQQEVPCDCVISGVWAPIRLADVLSAKERGIALPPIWLTAYSWRASRFYVLIDGNHRNEAANVRNLDFVEIKILRAFGVEYRWNPLRWLQDTWFAFREDRAITVTANELL